MNPIWEPIVLFAVMAGGALGTLMRYGVGVAVARWMGPAFPWGTLFINVSGSFAIGLLAELFALKWNVAPAARAFLVIGVCGGYTTFSTFSLDAVTLAERGAWVQAALYIAVSVSLSIGALVAANYLARQVL